MKLGHNVLTLRKCLCLDKLSPVQWRTKRQQLKTSIEVIIWVGLLGQLKTNYRLDANTIKNQINDFSLEFISALLITQKTAHLWEQHMKCLMQVLDF